MGESAAALVRLYESNKETDAAQHNLDAIYKERPNILGVIRTVVDFYWRNKMQPQALDIVERSIGIAQPPYKSQFMYEAASLIDRFEFTFVNDTDSAAELLSLFEVVSGEKN